MARTYQIDLYKEHTHLGAFDLPQFVTSEEGQFFKLGFPLKGGGNGIVFNSSKLKANRQVEFECAIKILRQRDESRIDRFHNEVRVIHELNSPEITKYYGKGVIKINSHEIPWVAMDLGFDNLRKHVQNKGHMNFDQLRRVGFQICTAIKHLHSHGFIHRDIKPDNFVWRSQSCEDIFMIDFGLAKRFEEDVSSRPLDNFTKTLEFVGPVFFSSPELIAYASNKKHIVDHRSDIFQLGKLLWYLGAGIISAGIPSKRDCPFGGSLHNLVVDLVQDHPDDRLQSVDDVFARIASLEPA